MRMVTSPKSILTGQGARHLRQTVHRRGRPKPRRRPEVAQCGRDPPGSGPVDTLRGHRRALGYPLRGGSPSASSNDRGAVARDPARPLKRQRGSKTLSEKVIPWIAVPQAPVLAAGLTIATTRDLDSGQ